MCVYVYMYSSSRSNLDLSQEACVSALVGSEAGDMALGENAQHLVIAYRFSMLEIYALVRAPPRFAPPRVLTSDMRPDMYHS